MELNNIEVDKKYRNIHTNIVCIVRKIAFPDVKCYNFKIDPCELFPKYIYYKLFLKEWEKII